MGVLSRQGYHLFNVDFPGFCLLFLEEVRGG